MIRIAKAGGHFQRVIATRYSRSVVISIVPETAMP
jgi:hypothetical protein